MKREGIPPDKGLRVTMQYRSGNGKVYELENAGLMLNVHVSPFAPADAPADASSEWLVEAHSSRAADAVVIAERAATRAEALREVGRRWAASADANKLPSFDWNAVESVLQSVRAL